MLSYVTCELTILITFLSYRNVFIEVIIMITSEKSYSHKSYENFKKHHEKLAYTSEHIIPLIHKSITIMDKNGQERHTEQHSPVIQKKIETHNDNAFRVKESRSSRGNNESIFRKIAGRIMFLASATLREYKSEQLNQIYTDT